MTVELSLALSLTSSLINRLPDILMNELSKIKNVDDILLSLIIIVQTIQRKLDQQGSEELSKPEWRRWVRKLIENFSEAEDEIDSINLAMKKLNHQMHHQPDQVYNNSMWSTVIGDISSRFKNKSPAFHNKNLVRDNLLSFKKMGVPNTIDALLTNFKQLETELDKIIGDASKRRGEMNLTELNAVGLSGIRLSSFCREQVNLTRRREEEKAIIINEYLLDLSPNRPRRGVAILGMAGLGKTTLARSIQRDDSIRGYFDRVIWALVPGNFCSKANIFFHDGEGIPLVDVSLHSLGEYDGKTLLVLDDIWNVEHAVWSSFRSNLGSEVRLLITTRDARVPKITEMDCYHLKELSASECKELIDIELPLDYLHRRDNTIKLLAQKCAGLPLVAKKLGQAIGSKCRTGESIHDAISRYEGIQDLWDLGVFRQVIFPSLKFNDPCLPPELSKCLAYMTLFPQDYKFKKDDLPLLWLAEGFLQPADGLRMTLELIRATDYFDDLHLRSILRLPKHSQQDDTTLTYQMHELFRGFAQSMTFNTCHQVEDGKSPTSTDHIRHLSIWFQIIEDHIFHKMICFKRLKTFLLLHKRGTNIHKIPEFFFTELHYLRVVNLSNSLMTSLPRSIRKLKLLRYLDVSNTPIQTLNDKLCDLFGLQILRLKNCSKLLCLPQGIGKLVNLIFLEVDIQCLCYLPPHMGSLINLQALEEFVVESEKGKRISELEYLNHLRGSIRIKGLENVKDDLEAKRANLNEKPHLTGIELHWTKMQTVPNSSLPFKVQSILTALQPNEGLQELKLMCYNGISFPSWFTSPTRDIKKIHLYDCPNIENLSLFWQLPYLNTLFVDTLSNMKQVNRTFLGDANSERFVGLERLEFRNMEQLSSWEKMLPDDFPSLLYVTIMNCPHLNTLPAFQHLPKHPRLDVSHCGNAP